MPSIKRPRHHNAKGSRREGARTHRNNDAGESYASIASDVPIPSIEMPPTPPAEVSSPESDIHERKKRRHHHETASGSRRRQRMRTTFAPTSHPSPTPEPDIEMEVVVKRVDRTHLFDPNDVERPSREMCMPWLQKDEYGNYPYLTDRTKIDSSIPKPLVSDLLFPDVLDDSPQMVTYEYRRPKKKGKRSRQSRRVGAPRESTKTPPPCAEEPVARPRARRNAPVSKARDQTATVVPISNPDPWQRQKNAPFIAKLTMDIRRSVFLHVLVATAPVAVHTNWRKIYPRQKAQLSIQLLRVCEALYHEALPILYGRNTFHYRIRDAVNSAATFGNIHHPALTAGNPGIVEDDDADDSGSDWERDCAPTRPRRNNKSTRRETRSSVLQKKNMDDSDIDVEKFGPLFRHLTIEAEPSMYGPATQDRMAKAIEVFKFRHQIDQTHEFGSGRLSIHTLTIRVTPKRCQAARNGYTIVDFFDPNSAVINAIKQLDLQHLRIEISRSVLDGTCGRATCLRGDDLEVIEVHFAHQRIAYNIHKFGEEDFWRDIPAIQEKRKEHIHRGRVRLESLADEVKDVCVQIDDHTSLDVADSEVTPFVFDDIAEVWDEDPGFDETDDEQPQDPADESGDYGETATERLARITAGQQQIVASDGTAQGEEEEAHEATPREDQQEDEHMGDVVTVAMDATDVAGEQVQTQGDDAEEESDIEWFAWNLLRRTNQSA